MAGGRGARGGLSPRTPRGALGVGRVGASRAPLLALSIQRKWFTSMRDELVTLQTQTFPQLEANINTFYTVPEVATKLSAITSIVSKLPGIIQSFVVMTINLVKTKRALRI